MKVAISGGTGLLGKALIPLIKLEGWTPVILSRGGTSNSDTRTTNYSKEDLRSKISDCDMAVHLAANRGLSAEIRTYHPDEIITQNLYETCLALGIQNIVYASSISVYSNQENLPWRENTVATPASMYGISKYTNELIGNHYNENYNMKIKNLRFAHLFGAKEENNYLVNLFMRLAYNHLPLVLHNQSSAKREFLYVKDAALAIVQALKHSEVSGTINIGSKLALTNYEVAETINEVFRNPHDILVQNPDEEDFLKSSYMTHELAKVSIDFEAIYSFKTALQEIKAEMDEIEHVPTFY